MTLRFVLAILCLDLTDSNNASDSALQLSWKGGALDDIFEGSLWVCGDEADGSALGKSNWVWESDFGWLQALLVDDVLLGCEGKPDRCLGNSLLVIVGEK